MVSGSRIEGGTQNLSAGIRKTIQSIKEIVGNHSDADIYVTLKETNMDPNETTQKLLNQDPFHEVRRKRDKKKEGPVFAGPAPIKPRKPVVQSPKPNTFIDRNPRRAFYGRNNAPDAGVTRPQARPQFRVVRDNRINQNGHKEIKSSPNNNLVVGPTKEPLISNVSDKSSAETSKNQKSSSGHNSSSQSSNQLNDSAPKQVKNVNSGSAGKRPLVSNVGPPKPHDNTQQSSVISPNSSVVGVYSSSSDPVHIPSLASRPAANVGAIKREVGPVGVRRHAATSDPFRSFPAVSKTTDQQQSESVAATVSTGRSFSNQYSSRPHQQVVAHQKVSQANKEWKPKTSQKASVVDLGVIGTPKKTVSVSKDLGSEVVQLPDNLVHPNEDQNVIIAAHIRVSEVDRSRLTFGSLGIEVVPSQNVEESHVEPLPSSSVGSPDSSSEEHCGSKQVEMGSDERVQTSGSASPESVTPSEPQTAERLESSSSQNMDNFTDMGLVRHSSPSYVPTEPQQQQQQHQIPSELPSFSQAYDPQTGYDISYFRPATDESLRGQMLQIPQEAFSSHPATTIPMVQQQQQQVPPPVAQMYPQVHLSHFANLMPYRQFLSPVYVPPMVMPGYSNNPTYSPSGSSYLIMPPGTNSPHNGLKYGIPQYKSVPGGSPTGFGNFTSPGGYTPGVVGSGSGLDDSARLKYKDGNVYVPNPQAETSELWMNPRDISSLHYNMAGQNPHAAGAYLPSHTAHASFNAAAAQSSHMQFPGLYHPPQPAAIANPHHMGPTMGGNVAAGAQVGGYQQAQLGQLSWTGNF